MSLREWAANGKFNMNFEGYSLINGKVRKGLKSWDVAGAHAQVDNGASNRRMTLTRVGAGAVVLGPVGAILGGMSKKDRSRVYVLVEFAAGEAISFDLPTKDEKKAREFAQKVNGASAFFLAKQQNEPPTT